LTRTVTGVGDGVGVGGGGSGALVDGANAPNVVKWVVVPVTVLAMVFRSVGTATQMGLSKNATAEGIVPV
jgi:hypothetical protein